MQIASWPPVTAAVPPGCRGTICACNPCPWKKNIFWFLLLRQKSLPFCAVDNTLNGEGLNNADNDPGFWREGNEQHQQLLYYGPGVWKMRNIMTVTIKMMEGLHLYFFHLFICIFVYLLSEYLYICMTWVCGR